MTLPLMKEFEHCEAAGLIATCNTTHDVINTRTACTMFGNPRTLPGATLQQVQKICEVEHPRALLVDALAESKPAGQTRSAQAITAMREIDDSLPEIKYFVILLADAYRSASARNPVNPSGQDLFERYTTLCPNQVAKVKQKLTAPCSRTVSRTAWLDRDRRDARDFPTIPHRLRPSQICRICAGRAVLLCRVPHVRSSVRYGRAPQLFRSAWTRASGKVGTAPNAIQLVISQLASKRCRSRE